MDLFGPWLGHEIPRGFRHFPPKLVLTSNHWHGPSQIHSNKNLSLYAYFIHLQTISSFGANEIRQFPCDSPASLPMSTYVRMMKSNILVASTLSFDGKNSVHQKNQSHVLVTSLISPRIIRIWNQHAIHPDLSNVWDSSSPWGNHVATRCHGRECSEAPWWACCDINSVVIGWSCSPHHHRNGGYASTN